MRSVNGSSIAVTPATCGPALRRFAAGLRWRYVCGQSFGAILRWALLLAVPVVLIAWLLPGLCPQASWLAVAILLPIALLASVRSFWRARKILGALRQSLKDGGGELATLHDELATWIEVDERAVTDDASTANGEMVRWLEQDVHARLAPHRKRALAAVGKPRLGRWRWLVPVVLLLLLIWLLAVWLAPPWSGVIGGLPNQANAGDQNGEGGGGKGDADPNQVPSPRGDANRDEQPDPKKDPDQQEQPQVPDPQQLPKPSEQPSESSPDPTEIPPLIELPDEQRFVVPEFIGDGPTRRARMHAAELEEQANANRPQPQGTSSGATSSQSANPKPTPPDFERAAEAAQRARHVPPAERAMVRRFFDKLRAKAK